MKTCIDLDPQVIQEPARQIPIARTADVIVADGSLTDVSA